MFHMKMLEKREFKLFIFFFIINFLFIHWVGWNEITSLSLTRAIVDERRLEIDNYINETGDRAFFNNKYYVPSSPGLSFISSPIYYALKSFFNVFNIPNESSSEIIEYIFLGERFVIYVNPGYLILASMVILTVLTSSLFGALSVVIFYRILSFYTNTERYKIILTLIYGLGSLVFPLSTVLFKTAISLFFILLSFYFLKRNKCFLKILLAGLFLGFSIFIDYSAIIIAIFFTILSFKYLKKLSKWFLFGIFLGIIPLLIYNFIILNNPFDLPFKYLDEKVWPNEITGRGESLLIFYQHQNPLEISIYLLFFPYRGLFIYYPIFLLSLISFYYFSKRSRFESSIFLSIFITFLILNSSYAEWWGGGTFGPRFLTLSIPFLILPLTTLLERKWKNKIFLSIFIILFAISIFNNFLGLQQIEKPWPTFNYQTKEYEYDHNIKSYSPLSEYYFPLFLKTGPRSRILEGLVTDPGRIDIRDFVKQPTNGIKFITTPFGFLTFRLQTLSISIIILAMFLIWRKEIIQLIPKGYSFFILLFLIFVIRLALDIQTINYGENWYPIYKNETFNDPYRWMSQNGTVYIFSPEKTNATLLFSFAGYKNQTFDIILNNEKINSYSNNSTNAVKETIKLNTGKNVLIFYSKEGCHVPKEWIPVTEVCLSIGISDIKVS